MESVTPLLIFLTTLLIYFLIFKRNKTDPRAVPSLPKLPFIGSAPWIFSTTRHLTQVTSDLVAKYGKIYGFWLGSRKIVAIFDPKLIKEAFNMEQIAGRSNSKLVTEITSFGKPLGIIRPDPTPEWKEQRRFILRSLKDFGFGQKKSEKSIKEEASYLVNHLQENSKQDEDFLIHDCFTVFVTNVIWKIVGGTRCYENSDEIKLLPLMEELFFGLSTKVLIFAPYSPLMLKIFSSSVQKTRTLFSAIHDLMRKIIDRNDQVLDEKAPRDLIDKYLVEVRKGTPGFHKQQLVVHLQDLFAAGSETTTSTLLWTVVYLLHHPQVQERCFKEIYALKGDNSVDLLDMENFPYCQATLLEIQRLGTVTPTSILHKTLVPVELGKYRLEADTLVFANFYFTHRDPTIWKEPLTFNPDRFLTQEGTLIKNMDYFTPFSIGRRVCLGESLAKAELWLFFTCLIQNFEFSAPLDHPAPSMDDCDIGISRRPKPFHCRINVR